jgi:HEAT repeat protein
MHARIMWIILLSIGLLILPFILLPVTSAASRPHHQGHLLFLLQQGEHEQALKIYQEEFQASGQHDFELLHQMGLRILDYGFRQNDPECQLLALFGAAVSAHEDAYYILEESIKSPYSPIQLVALSALARFQNDRADQAMMRALGSPSLEVRYEAIHQLCKKKHPQAISQAESLMYKTPRAFMAIFPPLFAMIDDAHSTRILRKLFNHSSQTVRLAVILSIAKYQRDDLLPQLRQQASQLQFALQEACAATLGTLKDEVSIPKLEKLALSQYSTVSLAAHVALYQLGREASIKAIELAAQKEDLFAISALSSIPDRSEVLLELLENPNVQIRFNAIIALLEHNHSRALDLISEVMIRDKKDLAFTAYHSPGHVFKAWKVTSSASQLLKDDLNAYHEHLELKESILEKVRKLSPKHFIALAHQILSKQQNDLVPHTIELLEHLDTKEAIECLKQHQQQFGAPLVRHYCNLALYRLQEPGPYAEQLRQWVKAQSQTQFIRFQPFSPWAFGENSYTLTPEETSKLLIESFETFATQQDTQGIETLIEAIATGHAKNKYALAGLLLRATQ